MLGFNKHDVRLTFNLLKMNVRDRYLGSALGSFWGVAHPLFLLAIYTFVFGFVFKVRLPGADTTLAYVIWLISGYGPWIAMTEAIMSSTTSVAAAAGVVKNLAFKTELLPISAAFVGLISLGVSLIFLMILMAIEGNAPGWRIVWLPLIVALQFFLIIAIGLWLSAINVFVRDLTPALPNALTILMFLTPVFYPVESMPEIIQKVSFVNPFYVIAEFYRGALLHHRSPSLLGVCYVFLLAAIIFRFGLTSFRRAKGFFDSAL